MLPSELAGGKYKICRASWLVGDSGKSVDVAILSAKRVIFRKISMLQSGGKIPSSGNCLFFVRTSIYLLGQAHTHHGG